MTERVSRRLHAVSFGGVDRVSAVDAFAMGSSALGWWLMPSAAATGAVTVLLIRGWRGRRRCRTRRDRRLPPGK